MATHTNKPRREQLWGVIMCILLFSIVFSITFFKFGREVAFIVGGFMLYLSALARYWIWRALAAQHSMRHYEEPE